MGALTLLVVPSQEETETEGACPKAPTGVKLGICIPVGPRVVGPRVATDVADDGEKRPAGEIAGRTEGKTGLTDGTTCLRGDTARGVAGGAGGAGGGGNGGGGAEGGGATGGITGRTAAGDNTVGGGIVVRVDGNNGNPLPVVDENGGAVVAEKDGSGTDEIGEVTMEETTDTTGTASGF